MLILVAAAVVTFRVVSGDLIVGLLTLRFGRRVLFILEIIDQAPRHVQYAPIQIRT